MSSVREPAGRSREMFWRPVLPSGKAKVRSLTSIVGEGILTAARREGRYAVDNKEQLIGPKECFPGAMKARQKRYMDSLSGVNTTI